MNSPNPMEVELKLALPPTGPNALRRHPLLADASSSARQQTLTNTYFDTPQGDLAKAHVALRIRQVDGQVLQTVKTAGQGGGGLSHRDEWEWAITGPQLDFDRLATLPPFQGELGRMLEALAPTLSTNFSRHSWQLIDTSNHHHSHVELVLDEGEIISGDYRTTIREIELELKSGEPDDLWRLALTLAEQVPLRPSDSSKAFRGNALSRQHWPLPDANTPAEWLHRATLALDAYHDSHQPSYLQQAHAALQQLAQHPALPAELAPLATALPQALDDHGQPSIAYGVNLLSLSHRLALQSALS